MNRPSSAGASSGPVDLVILGSTGSIGTQALAVVRRHPGRFRVVGLAAGGANLDLLARQIEEFQPTAVAIGVGEAGELRARLAASRMALPPRIDVGSLAVEELAGAFPRATVLNGITGGVGLGATLSALKAGSLLALANKESLVVGGHLVKKAQRFPGQIIPVDSEHSALAQALLAGVHEKGLVSPVVTGRSELLEIVLTASGGPFRGWSRAELADVTAKQALAHPTWDMGPVVTINSSTLMNKGLELIEASLLFDVPARRITPVVHPQSIVHSALTWKDGSTIAQAAYPNMEVPIALGLTWPDHLESVGRPLRWDVASSWTFEPVDHHVFPALTLAAEALAASPTHPAVLNAANEVCVAAFLDERLPYLAVIDTVAAVVEQHDGIAAPDLDDVLGVQEWAAHRAVELMK